MVESKYMKYTMKYKNFYFFFSTMIMLISLWEDFWFRKYDLASDFFSRYFWEIIEIVKREYIRRRVDTAILFIESLYLVIWKKSDIDNSFLDIRHLSFYGWKYNFDILEADREGFRMIENIRMKHIH